MIRNIFVHTKRIHYLLRMWLCAVLCAGWQAHAIEIRGLVDLRVGTSDADRSWTRDGLDKTRFDRDSGGIRLGQAFLRVDGEVMNDVSASVVASASDDRRRLLDITEAWLGWNPVPSSAWKTRVKFGAFFPVSSLEIDYDSIGWTPLRTISSSAINSWIGEELRTQGVELTMTRKGVTEASAHDYGFTLALFGRNDPIGSLLAWRGWSISDRITGLTESIRLADLPIYRADGGLPRQNRSIRIAREIDNRPGFYAGAHYAYKGWLSVSAMHYDNRGDPLIVKNGQYSWHTRFNHLSARIQPDDKWQILLQALHGETIMGPNAVHFRYAAWYALVSHPIGEGNLAVRVDRFGAKEHRADIFPSDPNGETGRAVAIAYSWPLSPSVSLVTEALRVKSDRPARILIFDSPTKTEKSLTASIRWQF